MFSMPDFLPLVLLPLWVRLLAWFSAQLYARLLPPADFLVQLAAHLELGPLEQACAAYQHAVGPGAKPTHPVARLVRALLVKSLLKLSLRTLEHEIGTNLVVKWFVGYAIFEPGPDHSTLARFEQWVIQHQHRTFFDEVLRQIDRDFPEERRQTQIGDTFAMQANAAKEGLVRLIRHTCQCLLRDLTVTAPGVAAAVTAQLDHTALFGAVDEQNEFYLDAEARRYRLQTTVSAALACADLVQSQVAAALPPGPSQLPERAKLTARLADLAKIVADEVAIQRDAAGVITRVETLPAKQQGSYRLGSATDPDATYRVHGANKVAFGYNINVAVNTHFVREIQAATGAQPDAAGLPALLTAQQEHHGVTPAQCIYDAAAGTAKTRALVAQVTADHTQLIAPLRPGWSRHALGPADCTLAADGLTLTCPNGQVSTSSSHAQGADGRTFRFTAAQCQDCPLWQACRGPKPPAASATPTAAAVSATPATVEVTADPTAAAINAAPATVEVTADPTAAAINAAPATVEVTADPSAVAINAAPATVEVTADPSAVEVTAAPAAAAVSAAAKPAKVAQRQFFISDYRDVLAQVRTFNATPAFKAAMQLRPGVERIIAGLTRYNGARRCQRRGQVNADYQAKMSGLAFNLKTWLRRLAERDRARQAAAA